MCGLAAIICRFQYTKTFVEYNRWVHNRHNETLNSADFEAVVADPMMTKRTVVLPAFTKNRSGVNTFDHRSCCTYPAMRLPNTPAMKPNRMIVIRLSM